jgi:hypothetical protein
MTRVAIFLLAGEGREPVREDLRNNYRWSRVHCSETRCRLHGVAPTRYGHTPNHPDCRIRRVDDPRGFDHLLARLRRAGGSVTSVLVWPEGGRPRCGRCSLDGRGDRRCSVDCQGNGALPALGPGRPPRQGPPVGPARSDSRDRQHRRGQECRFEVAVLGRSLAAGTPHTGGT